MKKIATTLLCSVVLLVIWAFNQGRGVNLSNSVQQQPEQNQQPYTTITGNVTASFASDTAEGKQ